MVSTFQFLNASRIAGYSLQDWGLPPRKNENHSRQINAGHWENGTAISGLSFLYG
jgi:hypothetical protein